MSKQGRFDNNNRLPLYEKSIQSLDGFNVPQNHTNENSAMHTSIYFRELALEWKKSQAFNIKRSSEMKYDYLIEKHINPILGDYLVSDIDSHMLSEYIYSKLKSGRLDGKGGLSPSYVRIIAIVINSIFAFGCQENLCKSIKIKRLIPTSVHYLPKTLSISEQRKLESYIFTNPDNTNLGILLALRAGLRIGEICALRWEHINFEDRIISVRNTAVRIKTENCHSEFHLDVPKTKSSIRDIPLCEELYLMLDSLNPENQNNYILSNSLDFVIPPTFEYRFHKTMEKASVKQINFHALRHTFATRCIEAGMDDKSLCEILGHSNVSITLNTYVHSSTELKKAHMTRLSALLSGN